ncbi:SpoIIE family protein phosphatase [Actinoplanes sp. NPDC049668]|uniref:SpoIIE family protein phosphatase n=1 Tax=unclassified Actinoplanes TaxID=2626549 RepID=UPI0033BDC155
MTDSGDGGPDVTQDVEVPWEEDPGDLYDHAPCGYLTSLPDGTIVKVNETFLAWTGYNRHALIGRRRFRDLLSAGDKIYYETHYAPLLSMQNDVHEVAFDLICADGRRLPILANSILGRDPAGLPRVIKTTILNATERRGYEKELLAARRAAEASERRVRVLQEIVADLAAAPTESDVADTVVRVPVPAFGAGTATVWLCDRDRDQLTAIACTDPAGLAHDDIPRGSSRAVAEVARRGDLHVIGSVEEAEEHFPDLATAMLRDRRGTVVLLPLTAASADDPAGVEVLGVLSFDFAEQRELSDSELRVVRLLGHQAGQALDRARLYDDLRRREIRSTFLAETTRALEEAPRLMPRARRLIERMVPEMAEWASVRLQVGPAGMVVDAGRPEPDPERLAERITEVLASGQAQLSDEKGPDPGCAVLPLVANGKVFGTLALRMAPGRRTAVAEAVFLAGLADRAGLALENSRLYEQERAIARTLQRSLLANDLPSDPRFAIESHYQAAAHDLEVGGDWFDAFQITSDKLAVVVGDVVGRGIDAATTMGQLRSAIRALASAKAGPARLLERLDRFVERVESARMATVAYAEVDLSTNEMTYACAGHMPPLLAEPGSAPRYLLDGRSGALGSRAGRGARVEHRVRLAAGSRLLLYTDGLIERRNRGIDAGFEVLARAYAGRRGSPLPGLAAGLADFLVGREHSDDVCLLCLSIGVEERLERSIGADPLQIALLRKDLRGWLVANGVDDESTQAVLLACSEAVANAIEHGYRDDPFGVVEVVAAVSPDAVEVRIRDQGQWQETNEDGARGRGLQLIRQVMDHASFDHDEGTTVTMRRARLEAR